MMVAAHALDTMGAQAVSFAGALITRPGNAALPIPDLPQPTIVATDLRDLATKLTNRAGPDVYQIDQQFRRIPEATMTATAISTQRWKSHTSCAASALVATGETAFRDGRRAAWRHRATSGARGRESGRR